MRSARALAIVWIATFCVQAPKAVVLADESHAARVARILKRVPLVKSCAVCPRTAASSW